jgi:hypothetical protein
LLKHISEKRIGFDGNDLTSGGGRECEHAAVGTDVPDPIRPIDLSAKCNEVSVKTPPKIL